MEKKTLVLILILLGVSSLSIKAGNKYNVDPSDYASADQVATEEQTEPVEEVPVEEVPVEVPAEAPVEGLAITFDSNHVVVEQGSDYDLTIGMTLHDDTDTEEQLRNNLKMYADPVFDVNVPGVYEITYVVTNSSGETATAERTFEVVPATSSDTQPETASEGEPAEQNVVVTPPATPPATEPEPPVSETPPDTETEEPPATDSNPDSEGEEDVIISPRAR